MLATAGASAREMGGKGGCAVAGGLIGRVCVTCSPESLNKHRLAFPKFGRSNDPNDDGTSSDPGDDEMWDDFAADDGSDLPVAALLHETDRRSITLAVESAPARTETPSVPSLSRLNLRC